MRIKVRHIIFTAVFCLFSLFSYSQVNQSEHPPAPTMYSTTQDGDGPPCLEEGEQPGTGGQIPPGLCVPINDYIYPLLVLGIVLGAFVVHRLEPVEED